jgi:multiple sugar transport system permease protein
MKKLTLFSYIIIVITVVIYGVPIFWIIVSSFKPIEQSLIGYGVAQILFLFRPTLDAYKRIFFEQQFAKYVINSLIVSSSSVGLSIIIGAPAAYTISRIKDKVTRNASMWIISARLMPPFTVALPFFVMMNSLGLSDTVIALMIVYLTFNLPFIIWVMRGYFEEIPPEIEKAARIDGCTRFEALMKVLLPLSKPALISGGIISFLLSWNEFLFAFILTSTQARTVTVHIANAVGLVVIDWPAMTAMSTITIIPSLIFIAIAQKQIIRGLTVKAW